MKLITTTILACALTLAFSCSLWCAEPNLENTVNRFIEIVASHDRKALANSVSYPLQRKVPLSSIDNPKQFLEAYDEIVDEKFTKSISTSKVSTDWSEMGYRGIMFQNGTLWLDEDGRISAINYETEKGKRKRTELIEADKQKLHDSLRNFVEPVLEWETAKYRIRIDQIDIDKFRYAAWPVQKKPSEKPDLILKNGILTFDGSGGNHHYDFKSGDVLYRCFVWVIGAEDTPFGEIKIYKHQKLVLSQPVKKVIVSR
jgi:hypothetical protein